MRDRLEKTTFVVGFSIGVAMGIATIGILLMRVAPAFKHISRYSYTSSENAARLNSDVVTRFETFKGHSAAPATDHSFARPHSAREGQSGSGVSSL